MTALVRAARSPDYPGEIAVVLSDRPDAAGLASAQGAGIVATAFARKDFASRAEHEAAFAAAIETAGAEIVCLAGFMRLLSSAFVERFAGRMINIHPSLLPKFPGLDTHRRALNAGETEHGCTVHFVTAEMDGGPVIAQARVPVAVGDTPDTLAERVLAEEHRLYPQALAAVLRGEASP